RARRRKTRSSGLPVGVASERPEVRLPPMRRLVVGHLFPDYLNIYADRGNIAVLSARAAWRGYELEVRSLGAGAEIRPGEHDLFYVGGGQDREQALIAPELAALGPALREAVDAGAACHAGRAIGTYLHGPLLPRNPWLADWLLAQAIAHRTGELPIFKPLADELEHQARTVSARRAETRGGRH